MLPTIMNLGTITHFGTLKYFNILINVTNIYKFRRNYLLENCKLTTTIYALKYELKRSVILLNS